MKHFLLPILLFPSLLASAQQTAVPVVDDTHDATDADSIYHNLLLDEVVITGTRTPKFLKDTPVQTRLITSKDIERLDATNVQDLLQQELPGVEFSYAMNQQTHLNFSGFGGQGILFLVDGERLAGETMDDVDFSRLNMDNVERIEIVRGASSALYGSNAAGGVVNIITKKARKKWSINADARYGKHNEQRYRASVGLGGKYFSNTLSANYNRRDNYDVHSAANPVTRVISTIYGDKTASAKEQLSWTPSSAFSLTGRAGYFFRETVRSADMPERYRDFSGGLRMKWDISSADALHASYAFDQYDKSEYQRIRRLDIRSYSNVQNSFRMLYSHNFDRGDVLTLGADYMHDYLLNTKLADGKHEQDCADIFAQYDCIISDKLEAIAAVRYDYFSDASTSRLTPKINFCYKPVNGLALRLGYGMGFRAPSLKERYYDFDMVGIWIIEGNKQLKPETSHNLTISAEYSKGGYTFTASTFYNNVNNKIATAAPYFKSADDRLPYLPYTNLDNYTVCGGEFGAQARWACGLSARLTYAFTHEELPRDKDGHKINNQYIPARQHNLNVRLDYDHDFSKNYGLSANLNGRVLSGMSNVEYRNYYDISQGTTNVYYPAYTVWRLSLVQRFVRRFKLTTTLDNILNYRPKYYYLNCPLTDGVNFQIGIAVSLD